MTPLQIVEARAPEFEGEARIADLITLAEEETGTDWGPRRNKAVALLVLHWLTLEKRDGVAGAILSESEGQVSRSYAPPSGSGDFATTAYGEEILRLRRAAFMGFVNRRTL